MFAHFTTTSAPPQRKTIFYDALRNFFTGSLLPLTEVILMLYFIEQLQGSTGEKTLLAMSIKSGYLLSIPLSLFLLRHSLTARINLSFILALSLAALLAMMFIENTTMVIALAAVVGLSLHGSHTVASEIYTSYAKKNRARSASFSNIALFLGSIVFTLAFRQIMAAQGLQLNLILAITIFALLLAIGATMQIKLPPLIKNTKAKNTNGKNTSPRHTQNTSYAKHARKKLKTNAPSLQTTTTAPNEKEEITAATTAFPEHLPPSAKASLSFSGVYNVLKNDTMFLYVLVAWMVLGLGNLWLLPFRTNLLVEETFGFQYTEQTVLLLLVVIPEGIYLLFSIPFGMLFDRFNFIALRIGINCAFIAYYVFFFFGDSLASHTLGMVCFGLARAGGTLAWKMWINKVVEEKKVPLYMAIHTGATGLRMVASPLFGLIGLYTLGPAVCGIISIAFMATSIAMFIPLLRYGKTRFNH